jgi:hypothetical protein
MDYEECKPTTGIRDEALSNKQDNRALKKM